MGGASWGPPSFLLEFWLLGSCTGLMHSTTLTLISCVQWPCQSRKSPLQGPPKPLALTVFYACLSDLNLGTCVCTAVTLPAAMIPQTSILSFVHYFISKTGIKSLPSMRINVQCKESDEHIIGTHWLTAYYGVRGLIALEKKNGQQEAYAEK